eukprot:5242643-Amphidinium_carterae.2
MSISRTVSFTTHASVHTDIVGARDSTFTLYNSARISLATQPYEPHSFTSQGVLQYEGVLSTAQRLPTAPAPPLPCLKRTHSRPPPPHRAA